MTPSNDTPEKPKCPECERLQQLVIELANRLANASEVLSKVAEKKENRCS